VANDIPELKKCPICGACVCQNEHGEIFHAAPKVKPLEWLELNDPIGHPQPYQIWKDNGGSGAPDDPLEVFEGYMLYSPQMAAMGVYSSIDDAKAAAQADYERRILSALE